jgi:hypothetical protein
MSKHRLIGSDWSKPESETRYFDSYGELWHVNFGPIDRVDRRLDVGAVWGKGEK